MMKPCQNGGKCRSRGVTTSPYYSCVCDAKWTGQNCQTKGTIVRCLHVQMYIRQFYAYMYSKSLAQSLLLLLFFLYRCCIAASPPKVAFPRKTGNVVVSPPPTGGGGGGLPYSRLPSSFLQSRLSPQCFWFRFLEKDYGKPIDIKINLLYIPRLLSLHTSVLLMFCQFIIFMNKLLFWFIKNTKNLCKNMFWMRKLKMSL